MTLFGTIALAGMLAGQTETPPDLSWMAGYWLSCEGGREVSETWSDPRAGVLVGASVTLSRGRASWEHSRIGPSPQGFGLHVMPSGQAPTLFPMVETGEARVVFADPAHDFPQRVIYSREGDRMTGRIEGSIDGQARSMTWTYDARPLNSRCPTP